MKTPLVFVFLLTSLVGVSSRTQDTAKPPGSGVATGVPGQETAPANMQLIKLARQAAQPLNSQLADSRTSGSPSVGRLKHGANRQPYLFH